MKDIKNDALVRVMNDYVILPRKYIQDVLDGVMSREEFTVLVWIRGSSTPYARFVTTIKGVNQDVFGGRYGDNYINKILLSLKNKKYLYYKPRQGHRGSFAIKSVDFLLPTKRITTYEGISRDDSIRSDSSSQIEVESEVITDLFDSVQKSDDVNSVKKQLLSSVSMDASVRGGNNDNYNNNNKDKNRSDDKKLNHSRPVLIDVYIPRTDEDEDCKQIAYQLGEQDMRFILSMKDRHGMRVIRQAYEQTRKYSEGNSVKNVPSLFNEILQKITKDDVAEKSEN